MAPADIQALVTEAVNLKVEGKMVNLSIAPTSNKLLASLSKLDRALLAPHLHIVPIKLNHVFESAHEPILDVYFLESGLASIVAGMEDSRKMEIGLTGRECMTGSSLFAGDDHRLTLFHEGSEIIVCMFGSHLGFGRDRLLKAMRNLLLRAGVTIVVQETVEIRYRLSFGTS